MDRSSISLFWPCTSWLHSVIWNGLRKSQGFFMEESTSGWGKEWNSKRGWSYSWRWGGSLVIVKTNSRHDHRSLAWEMLTCFGVTEQFFVSRSQALRSLWVKPPLSMIGQALLLIRSRIASMRVASQMRSRQRSMESWLLRSADRVSNPSSRI